MVWWLFVSRNGIKVQVLGVVYFKCLYLTVFCVTSWFVQQKRKTYWNLCVLCWLNHLSWFPGTKNIPPSFWSWVTNHDVSQKCQKIDFLGHCSFYTNFSWCWKADEKTWNICKCHTKILVCTTCWRNIYVYLCLPLCVFQRGRHHHFKWRRNILTKNLDDVNDNIFFWLNVWVFWGCLNQSNSIWAETVKNYPVRK